MAEQPFDEQTQEPEEPLDEQPFDEQAFKEYLRGVLKDTNPVITKLADLPSVWRDTPAGEPDPDHPGFPNRTALLYSYIGMADTQPPARRDCAVFCARCERAAKMSLRPWSGGPSTNLSRATLPRSAAGRKRRTGTSGFGWFTGCCGASDTPRKAP